MANKQANAFGRIVHVEHCGQNDGDGATNATCMELEKRERVRMREGKKGKNAHTKIVIPVYSYER